MCPKCQTNNLKWDDMQTQAAINTWLCKSNKSSTTKILVPKEVEKLKTKSIVSEISPVTAE